MVSFRFRCVPLVVLIGLLFIEGFSLTATSGRLCCGENDSKESLIQRVEILLSDEAAAAPDSIRTLFQLDRSATVPIIYSDLRQGSSREAASRALAYLGGPAEHRQLREAFSREQSTETKWTMASFLAGALVPPASEAEWKFLEMCIRGYKEEVRSYAAFSAALALGTNASPRALQILQSVGSIASSQTSDKDAFTEVQQAIHWIERASKMPADTAPPAAADSQQIEPFVTRNTFFLAGQSQVETLMVFTPDKRRALVSVDVSNESRAIRGYDVVLEKRSEGWRIVGVWFSWSGDKK